MPQARLISQERLGTTVLQHFEGGGVVLHMNYYGATLRKMHLSTLSKGSPRWETSLGPLYLHEYVPVDRTLFESLEEIESLLFDPLLFTHRRK